MADAGFGAGGGGGVGGVNCDKQGRSRCPRHEVGSGRRGGSSRKKIESRKCLDDF